MTAHPSIYYDPNRIAAKVSAGAHREAIGGMWDEIGALQLDFLRANGLRPQSRLLDIGCGSLRLGVRAVEYLEAGNYWGTDLNESLLNAGWEKEIVPAGLAHKLPRGNLVVDADFTFAGVPRAFDFAMAQSVFTHLPLNHMRLCLINLAAHIEGACTFFATAFIAPEGALANPCRHQPGNITTHPHRDPYHYAVADLAYAASGTSWQVEFLGDWAHPRNQKIARFRKAM
jgi:cyclopropane fatty-acyl-phospholipid synthase-like methyltransferase